VTRTGSLLRRLPDNSVRTSPRCWIGRPPISLLAFLLSAGLQAWSAERAASGPTDSGADEAYRLAVGLHNVPLYREAVTQLRAFLNTYPRDPRTDRVLYRLGDCLIHLDRPQEAVETFRHMVARFPKSEQYPEALFRLAELEHPLGNPSEAHRIFERFLREFPQHALAPAAREKEPVAVVAALDAQADRNPEKALAMANAFTNRADVVGEEALFLRGVLLFNGGQLLDAARTFEAFLARFPQSNRADEIDGSLSADGHLYFYSDRPGGSGGYDLNRAPFQPEGDEFGEAVNLGPVVNSPFKDYDPFVSRDGQRLFFSANRPSGGSEEDYDLDVAVGEADGSWGPPQRLPFNTPANEWEPAISADGLSLYFSSNRGGGFGG